MRIPLHINLTGMPSSAALETQIRDQVDELVVYFPYIISCQVSVEMLRRHHRGRHEFNVRMDIDVAENEIIMDLRHYRDLETALQDVFGVARRQMTDPVLPRAKLPGLARSREGRPDP